MPNINGRTLALAIQAVDFKIADLEQTIDSLPADEGCELETLLLSYTNAAEALKRAYQEALAESDNLPPYEKLVRSDD
ncbi:hypothetical protein [Methylobacter sp.]|jgi:hypothetical protein|uniref:hypothetical protein n=1 Tax=Methylobacter sp. TaxID=2051955 RepID=UPI003DA312FF